MDFVCDGILKEETKHKSTGQITHFESNSQLWMAGSHRQSGVRENSSMPDKDRPWRPGAAAAAWQDAEKSGHQVPPPGAWRPCVIEFVQAAASDALPIGVRVAHDCCTDDCATHRAFLWAVLMVHVLHDVHSHSWLSLRATWCTDTGAGAKDRAHGSTYSHRTSTYSRGLY